MHIHNDVAQSTDVRRGVILVLIDLTGYGIRGEAHAWVTSYLHGRRGRSGKVGPRCHSDPDMHCSQMNGSSVYRPAREHHSTS